MKLLDAAVDRNERPQILPTRHGSEHLTNYPGIEKVAEKWPNLFLAIKNPEAF